MRTFASVPTYLDSLRHDSRLAVISMKMAADALRVSRAAIERQIANGDLKAVKIGKARAVLAEGVTAKLDVERGRIARVREILDEAATKRETTTYAPVMEQVGLSWRVPNDRSVIGWVLGEISKATRPDGFMLSALVYNRNLRRPSPSFFGLARELYGDIDDEDEFLADQLRRIWKHYRGAGAGKPVKKN